MFQISVWCEKWVAARRNSVIGNQLLFANNRNMIRWVVLCLSHDGACTDSFDNFREISLTGDLSNDITLNPPLFSLPIPLRSGTDNADHRVYRVPGLSLQSSELAPPAPSLPSECCPPPPLWFRRGDTLACGRVGWRSRFGRRDRHSGTLGIQWYNPSTMMTLW